MPRLYASPLYLVMIVLRKQGSCFVFRVEKTDFKCCISHEFYFQVTEKALLLQSAPMTHNGHCDSFNIRISCSDSSIELLDDMCTEPHSGSWTISIAVLTCWPTLMWWRWTGANRTTNSGAQWLTLILDGSVLKRIWNKISGANARGYSLIASSTTMPAS